MYFGSVDDQRYKLQKVVTFNDPCEHLAVSVYSIFVAHNKKIRMMNFNGGLEREWVFDSPITCIKFIGGPLRREAMIIGLQSGNVFKIFSENPFPILLIQQTVAVKQLDISFDLKKIAIVINYF